MFLAPSTVEALKTMNEELELLETKQVLIFIL